MTRFIGALFGAILAAVAGGAHAQTLLGGGGGGGGGSGCTPSGSAGNVLTDSGSGACNSDANATLSNGALSLGSSGTAGSLTMGNATSGTITVQPVTGALGTITEFLPISSGDTLVGLAATQTLTNKTLTSPTINGGALSGTLTGTPTLSGNLTFSGVPLMTGLSGGTVVSYVGLDSGNNLVLGTPSGSGNALFGTTTGNTAGNVVTMSNTTVGVEDSGTALSSLVVTWPGVLHGGLLTNSGNNNPGQVLPSVNGDCAFISGGAWTVGPTGGCGNANFGTATGNTSGDLVTMANTTTGVADSGTKPGTGVLTALGVNVGTAGAFVVLNGAGGTPSSLTITNATGLLPAGGGTGLSTITAHGVMIGEGTSNVAPLSPSATSGVPLLGQGSSSDPAWGSDANLAYLDANQAWTKGQYVTPDSSASCGTQSSGGTMTPNFANSNSCLATFGAGNLTIANPSNAHAGQTYLFRLVQDGTGGRTVTWGADYFWAAGNAPTLSTGANAIDLISCFAPTSSEFDCTLSIQGAQS